ncbi:RNA polymerase sigma factor [Jatrophihabitans sp. YIM 134969]
MLTTSDLPEDVLVARAREGDTRSFEILLRRYERMAYASALRILGRRGDAEDALQDAFLAAWRQLPDFRGDSAFSTWLHRIVTTRALNQIRSRARHDDRREGPDIADVTHGGLAVASGTTPESQVEAGALLAALQRALADLPEQQRWCWVLREIDGCSYEDVAEITGASVTTVRGRLHRARITVAEAMAEWR